MNFDIAIELARLHILHGADFVRQLKLLASFSDFHLVKGEKSIYAMGGEQGEDYEAQMNAARKLVLLGYRVFILPNPHGIRTADFIVECKGVYKMYDLKTVQGKTSVLNRLLESIGQTSHVLLNVCSDYNARLLATQIKTYFEVNDDAIEVLVMKGRKTFSVTRRLVTNSRYLWLFRDKYEK